MKNNKFIVLTESQYNNPIYRNYFESVGIKVIKNKPMKYNKTNCEHDWRKSSLTVDDEVWTHQCKKCFITCHRNHGRRDKCVNGCPQIAKKWINDK